MILIFEFKMKEQKVDSSMNVIQESDKKESDIPKSIFTPNLKLLVISIIGFAILAAALSIILSFSLRKKNKKTFKINIIEKNPWNEAYKKAENFVSKLNLTEKVNLLFGTENMKMETF